MPTAAEVLKSVGLDDAAIAAIDAKAMTGFATILTTAEQERSAAELAQRAATQYFEQQITPALNDWGSEKARLAAERDYYKTLAKNAEDGGFIANAPPFEAATPPAGQQPRNPGGQFVPNANVVPGSPDIKTLEAQLGTAFGVTADLQWKYQKLFGTVMPDSPTVLAAEASAQKLPLADYAARKYGFDAKQKEIEAAEKQKHEDAIRKEAIEGRDKYWSERTGANPMVRAAETSRFSELKKGVEAGTRIDPLKMTPDQRRTATRDSIRQDIAATTAP